MGAASRSLCGWRETGIYGRSHRVKARNGMTVLKGLVTFLDANRVRVTSIAGQYSLR